MCLDYPRKGIIQGGPILVLMSYVKKINICMKIRQSLTCMTKGGPILVLMSYVKKINTCMKIRQSLTCMTTSISREI